MGFISPFRPKKANRKFPGGKWCRAPKRSQPKITIREIIAHNPRVSPQVENRLPPHFFFLYSPHPPLRKGEKWVLGALFSIYSPPPHPGGRGGGLLCWGGALPSFPPPSSQKGAGRSGFFFSRDVGGGGGVAFAELKQNKEEGGEG
eukprot:FR742913.1.p2 GENE.FR742913.1~~FR742913.1.p2  ORF type:complete len:146 (+),score=60.90 FR742913.1:807-1244(+)